MIKKIPNSKLKRLNEDHKNNTDAAFITNSIVIERIHLEQFMAQAAATPNCDAIRIHFVRHELTASQPHVLKVPDRDLSQVSLAFVPANITNRVDWIAVDIKDQNNDILTLLVCEPLPVTATGTVIATRSIDDKTGQCLPKCPGDSGS